MAGWKCNTARASFLMAQWSRRLATISNHFWNQKIPGSTPGGEASFLHTFASNQQLIVLLHPFKSRCSGTTVDT